MNRIHWHWTKMRYEHLRVCSWTHLSSVRKSVPVKTSISEGLLPMLCEALTQISWNKSEYSFNASFGLSSAFIAGLKPHTATKCDAWGGPCKVVHELNLQEQTTRSQKQLYEVSLVNQLLKKSTASFMCTMPLVILSAEQLYVLHTLAPCLSEIYFNIILSP
jgi:hypothetical protein